MKTKTTQFCAIVASMALLNAGYGAPGSFEFADPIPPATTDSAPILLAADMTFQRIVQTQTTFIQHEATERQRRIAQAHALAFIKHLQPEKKVATKKNGGGGNGGGGNAGGGGGEKPSKPVVVRTPKPPRYIAVDTEKNAQTSPKAKKVVMVWDTQSESLVGNTVYDLPDPPAVGKPIVFATYSAEYVASGN